MSLEHAFFYKSVNGDRIYDDVSFEHWLKKFFTSGVFLNDLQVTANDDMTITVGAGYTNIDGKVKIFESATPLIIETAGASYPRIDSIVLERNDTERDILLKVVKGGYSSEPVPHTPVRQDGVYQLVIAQILVNAGAVKVTQADITDTRSNTELCGIVAGAVEQIDFSQIQAQFDSYFAQYKTQIATDYTEYNADMETYLDQMAADFATWFQNIRNQLDEDAAGHLQNQIDDIKAEMELLGGSIVEITIIDDENEYNVEGLEVNLEIDGKTYTEIIPSEKVVKFTGVLEVGTATITCVDETQEFNAETSIEIPYYGAYECSIVGVATYKDWIEAGGLNPSSYESLDALLEDETAIRTLMTKKAAVDVLARMSGDVLATIINHPYVAKWVNYREYAYSTLSAAQDIKTIMDASGMYGIYITVESDGTWKPKGLVPVMTSNTAPYGEIIYDVTSGGDTAAAPYRAFDGDITTDERAYFTGFVDLPKRFGYKFASPTCCKSSKMWCEVSTSVNPTKWTVEASNDNINWVVLGSFENDDETAGRVSDMVFENENYYLYYSIKVTESVYNGIYGTSSGFSLQELQFYGRQLVALIPPMTSNTAPIGNVTYSSIFSTTYDGWRAFDCGGISTNGYAPANSDKFGSAYVQYEFEKPVMAKVVGGSYKSGDTTCYYKLQASNNGETFDTIVESIKMIGNANMTYYNTVSDKAYKYYRFIYVSNTANDIIKGSGAKFQLYGTPDYESRTYIYEHGVDVLGGGFESRFLGTGATFEKKVDCLKMYKADASNNEWDGFAVCTTDMIDVSLHNILNYSIETDKSNGSVLSIVSSNNITKWSEWNSAVIAKKETSTNYGRDIIDVTNCNQKAYVCISSLYTNWTTWLIVNELWLE